MKTPAAVALVALLASGCAIGNKQAFVGSADLDVQGVRSVAVATEDLRPYVVSKEKPPTFVGVQRGGFGTPFSVSTESGKPLADDFSTTVARSLERKGFKTQVVSADAGADPRALVSRSGAERLSLLTIREWRSDTYQNTGLTYDLTLRVFDSAGAELASNNVSGSDDLGGNFFNPVAHAQSAVPLAYQKKLAELFTSEAIARSLQ
jgi:hypothetical protein